MNLSHRIRIATGSAYVVLGLYIFFVNVMPGSIDPSFKNIMGIVLICYGIYRIVHTQYAIRQTEKFDDEQENTGK